MKDEHEFDQAPADDPSRTQAAARYAEKRTKASKGKVRTVIIVVLALVVAAFVGASLYVARINSLLETKDAELLASLKDHASDEPFYMLLLGVDKGEERYATEGSDSSNYRADTIMLARIDPGTTKATIVSIHRDLLVELANDEMGKINAAYSLGGPAGMVNQVSELAGVDIHHYAEIDFDAFMGIVDAIGGVEVTLPVEVRDPEYTQLNLDAGTHVLNGYDALMLCRARHAYDAYGDGDVFRAANQRMVISAIVKKVLASSPHTMVGAISSMAESVTTDMSLNDILALAAQMQNFNTASDLYTGMTPSEPQVIDDIYYEILDEDAWQHMMQRVDQGLSPYDSDEEDTTRGIAGAVVGRELPPAVTTSDDATDEDATDADNAEAVAGDTSLAAVDKSGSVSVVGMPGSASGIADQLVAQGFDAAAYEDETYAFGQNLVVYDSPAYEEEAVALAAYLGDDFQAVLNDGSFYQFTNITVRIALY